MSSLGRASALLGAGTLVSRVTGLIRTIVLLAAIGSFGKASDAFSIANQLPNNVFTIIQTGILTAVIIPQIVRAGSHRDGGRAYISKLFTLGTLVFLAATAVAMIAAPLLITLYTSDWDKNQIALATAFAYWCLPQIFFYGLYALIGETLNARKVFGPYTWSPVANNVVSIIGFLIFIALFGENRNQVEMWNPTMISVMGATATLGIAVQAGILLFAWRSTGLSLRPDFAWRGVGLRNVGTLAGWTFLMVIAGQIAGWVQTRVVSEATGHASSTVMMAAWLVFMLPYSIFAISIGTPYFTQIAEHAAAKRDLDVRADVARCIRVISLFVVGSGIALAAAAVPATRIFTTTSEQAVQAAPVLICYLVGLLPLALLFIVQRAFYAYGDTRTPFYFTLVQVALIIGLSRLAGAVAPIEQLAAAIALGQSIAGIIQTIIAIWILRNRLGGLEIPKTLLSLLRFIIAAIPAGFAGWGTYLLLGAESGWTLGNTGSNVLDRLLGAVGTGVIGLAAVIVYVIVLLLLRAPELSAATRTLRRFLPGR
ncbi:murein biosynthesis integral membrane protein MurJ [Microbacterium sp. NPDC057944]|uniref:murein biosynthesis integral membrane protein MurJ n=1 Tax=Microbacterium sp. NPDC057944 TaxID=3346286 RepID=UPI0036D87D8F